MVLSGTDRKQSDGPLPQLTPAWTPRSTAPPSPFVYPNSCLYCGAPLTHPPQLYTRRLRAPGDLVHPAVIWAINDKLDVSKEDYFARLYRIFYSVKIVECVTRAHLKGLSWHVDSTPPAAVIHSFLSEWFQTMIPALHSFTDWIWAHLWMSSCKWMNYFHPSVHVLAGLFSFMYMFDICSISKCFYGVVPLLVDWFASNVTTFRKNLLF